LFDLSITKLLVLGIIGLMIFGPDQLPKIAAQAGKALRDLRRLADSARADLTDQLGPEFSDFDFNDLNPRAFVRKHLLDEFSDDEDFRWAGPGGAGLMDPDPSNGSAAVGRGSSSLIVHDSPPFDADAT
jgi:sec-independent protein translocase protein TatB